MNSLDTKRREVERLSKDTLDFGHSIQGGASSADLDKFQRMTEELRQKRHELAELENHPLSKQGDPVPEGIVHNDEEMRDLLSPEAFEAADELDYGDASYNPMRNDPDYRALRGALLGPHAPKDLRRAAEQRGWYSSDATLKLELPFIGAGRHPKERRWLEAPRTAAEVRERYAMMRGYRTTSGPQNPRMEMRQQSVGTPALGGYTVANEIMAPLEVAMRLQSGMRILSRTIPTATGALWQFPLMDDLAVEGAILAENTVTPEVDLNFSQIARTAVKYTSNLVRASLEFMQDTSIPAEAVIGNALGLRIGRVTNKHFTIGTGTGQPQGIINCVDSGVKTTGTALSTMTFETWIDFEHSIDPRHRAAPNAGWMMHDDVLREVRKLKDDRNRPIYQESLVEGTPGRLLGYPVVLNMDMPKGDSADTIFAIFGDHNSFIIRDAATPLVQIFRERYMDAGQFGFLVFSRHDSFWANPAYTNTQYAPLKFAKTAAA